MPLAHNRWARPQVIPFGPTYERLIEESPPLPIHRATWLLFSQGGVMRVLNDLPPLHQEPEFFREIRRGESWKRDMKFPQEAEGEVLDRAASGLLREIREPTLSMQWEDSLEAFRHLFVPFGGARAVYWKTAQGHEDGSPRWVRVNLEQQVGVY